MKLFSTRAPPRWFTPSSLVLLAAFDQFFGIPEFIVYVGLVADSATKGRWLLAVGAVHVVFCCVRLLALARYARPVQAWLGTSEVVRRSPTLLARAGAAAYDLPYRYARVHAVTWAATFPVAAALVALSAHGAGTAWRAALFGSCMHGVALGLAGYALHLPLWGWLVGSAAGEISLAARRTRTPIPGAPRSLLRRTCMLGACLALAPLAWFWSYLIFHTAGLSRGILGTSELGEAAAFFVIVFVWAWMCARLHAWTLARPIVRLASHVSRLARSSYGEMTYAPACFRDETGALALAFDDAVDELSARAARISAQDEERERLLSDLRVQHNLLRDVVDELPVELFLLAADDESVPLANRAFRRRADDPALSNVPDVAAIVKPLSSAMRASGDPQRVREAPLGRKYLDVSCVPLHAAVAERAVALVVLVDVTQQVAARTRIEQMALLEKRRAAEVEAILDHIVEFVAVCDGAGTIVRVNRSGRKLIGMPDAADARIPPRPWMPVFDAATGKRYALEEFPLSRALRGEIVRNLDVVAYPPGRGEMRLAVSAAPIRDAGGAIGGAVVVARDVTEERELAAARGQFVRVAAHELKTPVAVVKANAQLLLRHPADPERIRSGLGAIDRGADRIHRIVLDLLDLTQLDLGTLRLTPEPVDLSKLVKGVTAKVAERWPGRDVRYDMPSTLQIVADPARLGQVVDRVVDNAFKHSRPGTPVEIDARRDDGIVKLSVTDHGIGIPPPKQRFIFQPFYRAHAETADDYGGFGVSLYVARELVRRHGGELDFSTEEGRGTTFRMVLRSERR